MNALQNGRSLQGANGAKSFFQKYYLVITFLLMFVVSCLLSPKFFTPLNLLNILTQNATTAILSYGMLFVIVTGGIDLSVGSFLALSVCLTAGLLNQNWPIAAVCLFVVLVMAVGGAIAGGLIAFGKIEPFIATLAMQQVVRGIAYIYQVGSVAVINNQTFLTNFAGNLGPIPIAIIYAAIIGVIMHILLKNTTFGREPAEDTSGHWVYAMLRHDARARATVLVVGNLSPEINFYNLRISIPQHAFGWCGIQTDRVRVRNLMDGEGEDRVFDRKELMERGLPHPLKPGHVGVLELSAV